MTTATTHIDELLILMPSMVPAAEHVDGRVDGGSPEVGGRQRNLLELATLGHDSQEDGLQDVLGVGRIAGDAQGRAEHRLVMPLIQLGKPRHRGS